MQTSSSDMYTFIFFKAINCVRSLKNILYNVVNGCRIFKFNLALLLLNFLFCLFYIFYIRI